MHRLIPLLLMASLFLIPAAWAQTDDDSAAADDGDQAQIRLAHFGVGAPDIDLYINGNITDIQGLRYTDITGWYRLNTQQSIEVTITAEDAPIDEALLQETLTIDAGTWVTLAVIGIVEAETLSLSVLTEDFSPLDAVETRVTLFHAAPLAAAVDLFAGDIRLIGALEYPGNQQDNDGIVTRTIDEVNDVVTIVDSVTGETIVDLGDFTFSRQRHYFIAVISTRGDQATYRLVSTEIDTVVSEFSDVQTPRSTLISEGAFRMAHLSSGTPPLDIYINGETVATELAFGSITPFRQIAVGDYEIGVTPTGQPLTDAILTIEMTVDGGDYLTVAIRGVLVNETLTGQVLQEDFSPIDPGLVRVSVFHAYPTIGPVDLLRDDGLDAIRVLAYPFTLNDNDGFASVDLLAGTYDFTVVDSLDQNRVIAEITGLNWQAGRNYFVAVVNAANGFTLTFEQIPE